MTFNISLTYEQQQRLENDLVGRVFSGKLPTEKPTVAVEAQSDRETDLYYHGEFDGATGGKPEQELWSNLSYRSGWLAGVEEYYDKKFQRDLPLVGKPDQASSLNFTAEVF